MTTYQWFVFFLIVQLIHGLGTWKLYEKAGRKSWEAFIPVYNSIVLMKIINRPTWYTFLLFLPVINLMMFPIVWVETLRSFGKNSSTDTFLGVITCGFYIYYINYTQKVTYITDRSTIATTKTGDTVSSLLFAIIVATFVHTYFIQPFVIPSSSLEKSLLIGDFLFVSKQNYGARTPMTTVAAPMVHDTLPFIKKKSYTTFPQLPYFRFPGFEKIKNNDIVVFNWPRDTLFHMYLDADKRYDKPIDKKTNYVKRCVGIPGDSLQIKDGIVWINGKELILPDRAKPQYNYNVYSKKGISAELLKEVGCTEFMRCFEVTIYNEEQSNVIQRYARRAEEISKDGRYKIFTDGNGIPESEIKKYSLNIQEIYLLNNIATLTFDAAKKLKASTSIDSVVRYIKKGREEKIFPCKHHDGADESKIAWSGDNYGPIYIPQAGKTVALTLASLPFYKIIIKEYEGNKLKVVGNDIYVNDKIATSYTFKQNYYWMMGDNRHNSLDARYFGYTPEDHIVGKPIFIWMSWDSNGKGIMNKIRWERLFTTVSGEGQPQSYFKYFLALLALYFVGEYFWTRRKAKKTE
jgi:signal peptidase I